MVLQPDVEVLLLFIGVRAFGLEFCFDQPIGGTKEQQLVHTLWPLAAVHVYNDEGTGFSKCPLGLPHLLRLDMKAKEVVQLLGEPQKKFSGQGEPVTITYTELIPKTEVST